MLTFKDKQRTIRKRLDSLRERATKSELVIQILLNELGERHMFQKGFFEGDFYCIVDFYLPKRKLCIEVDGGYHFSDEQRVKDFRKDKYLKEYRGFKVLRISNEAANAINSESLKILILKA